MDTPFIYTALYLYHIVFKSISSISGTLFGLVCGEEVTPSLSDPLESDTIDLCMATLQCHPCKI